MGLRDAEPPGARPINGSTDCTICAPPSEDQQIASLLIPKDLEVGDTVRDASNFVSTEPDHRLVILRIVADLACDVLLLQSTDSMLQTWCPWNCPRPRELFIAIVWVIGLGISSEVYRDVRKICWIGNLPGLGTVGEIAVRENEDRRHVLRRDPRCLDCHPETVAGSLRSNDRNRTFAVATVKGLHQIGLLRLRRKAGARTATLNINDDHRKLRHHREPDRFGLQGDARTARRCECQGATKSRAKRGGHCGNLVLGLERDESELLESRNLVQDLAGGSDRIASQEPLQLCLFRRSNHTDRQRLVPHDVAVAATGELCGRDLVPDGELLHCLSQVVAGRQRTPVCLGQRALVAKLLLYPFQRRFHWPVVEPIEKAERKEVLATSGLLGRKTQAFNRSQSATRDRDGDDLVACERPVLQRVLIVPGKLEIATVKCVAVCDDHPSGLESEKVGHQSRGIHRHQHVGRVTGRVNVKR